MSRSRRSLLAACAIVLSATVAWRLVGDLSYTEENGGQGLDHLVHPSLAETTARVVGELSTVALAFVPWSAGDRAPFWSRPSCEALS